MTDPMGERVDLLRACAERTRDLVVLADPAGRVLYANPAAAAVLGLAAGPEGPGSLLESAHPDDRAALRGALEGGRAAELAVRHGGPAAAVPVAWRLEPLAWTPRVVALWAPASTASPLEPIALDVAAVLHDVKNPISGLRLALAALARALGEEERAILGNLVERLQKVEGALRAAIPPR